MESMHTMSSTDMHIMRLPSEDDPMMVPGTEKTKHVFTEDQEESGKQLSDLVAEAEKSNSLIAYSSYNNEDKNVDKTKSVDKSNEIDISQDVYAQLAQKEKDLVLAAELGKALLGKNEDLVRQNEKLADDFSQQLGVRIK